MQENQVTSVQIEDAMPYYTLYTRVYIARTTALNCFNFTPKGLHVYILAEIDRLYEHVIKVLQPHFTWLNG
jgi:hypothetical protein